jgi:hypothetical protein
MTGNTTALFVAEPHHKDFDGCRLAWFVFQLLLQRRTKSDGSKRISFYNQYRSRQWRIDISYLNHCQHHCQCITRYKYSEKVRIDADGEVGIGTNNPLAKLHIVNATSGAIRIEDGTQANGNILTSDANGVVGEIEYDFLVFKWKYRNYCAAIPALYGTTTIASTENFIGTTDDQAIVFGTNNIERMRINNITGQVKLAVTVLVNYGSAFDVYTDQYVAGVFREMPVLISES